MGLSVHIDEDLFAAVIEPSDKGLGVQEVMAKEGGLARYRDHTITGNTDRVSVDYGKIFAAQGKRMEYSAAMLTHIPADMMTPDNDMEGPNGAKTNRPDLELLKQFSPEYLLALEGVGEALELLLSGDLSPEAQVALSELLTGLSDLKNLMELAAEPGASKEITERLEQKLKDITDTIEKLDGLTALPQGMSDFALDVMAEAASLAPISQNTKTAITKLETKLGRATPPIERMALSALILAGKSGTSPLAIKARPSAVKAANNNAGTSILKIATMIAAPKAQAAKPSTLSQTVAKTAISNTTADTAPAPAQQNTAPAAQADITAVQTVEATAQPQPAMDHQSDAPHVQDVQPIEQKAAETPIIIAVADNDNTVPTPIIAEMTAPHPVSDDIGPGPITQPPAPQPDITDDVVLKTPDPIKNPEVVQPIQPTDKQPEPVREPVKPNEPTKDTTTTPKEDGHICKCKDEFNQMAKGNKPDTRTENDFKQQYGEDLYNKMGGAEALKKMESDNNAFSQTMENLAKENGPTAQQQQHFNNAWADIIANKTNPTDAQTSSRTQTFEAHVCNAGCDHSSSHDTGTKAHAVTDAIKQDRKLAL